MLEGGACPLEGWFRCHCPFIKLWTQRQVMQRTHACAWRRTSSRALVKPGSSSSKGIHLFPPHVSLLSSKPKVCFDFFGSPKGSKLLVLEKMIQ